VSPLVSLCSLGCKMQPGFDPGTFIHPVRFFTAH
jgi:hypothetical protein